MFYIDIYNIFPVEMVENKTKKVLSNADDHNHTQRIILQNRAEVKECLFIIYLKFAEGKQNKSQNVLHYS